MADGPVLVDSSIWVEIFRTNPPESLKRVLTPLVESGRAVVSEMIRLEVIAGARSLEEFGEFRADLEAIPCVETTAREWRRAEDITLPLGRAGQRVAAADVLIAAVAICHKIPLWHADSDFERIRRVVGSQFQTFGYPKQTPSI